MIITCSHNGIGEPSMIELRRIGFEREVKSGDLRASLDDIVESKSGAAKRGYHAEVQNHTDLSITCKCGLSLRADWSTWLGYWLLVQQTGDDRRELLDAARAYQSMARTLRR